MSLCMFRHVHSGAHACHCSNEPALCRGPSSHVTKLHEAQTPTKPWVTSLASPKGRMSVQHVAEALMRTG